MSQCCAVILFKHLLFEGIEELMGLWCGAKCRRMLCLKICLCAFSPFSPADIAILGMDIDLQTIEDNVISLEMLFKTWLHDCGSEREHLHLLLPSGGLSCGTAPKPTLSISFSLPLHRELLTPTTLKITQACPGHVPLHF